MNLSGLTTINEPNAGVQFTAHGSGSQLNLSALTSFTEDGGNSTFEVTDRATPWRQPGHLQRSPTHPLLTGIIATSQWTTLTNSSLTITGGANTFAGLTDVALTSLQLSGGATLSLPALVQGNLPLTNGQSVTIQRHPGEHACRGNFGCHNQRAPVPGIDPDPENSGTLTGTTFNVGQGTTVDLTGGTYTGGVVFNVARGRPST